MSRRMSSGATQGRGDALEQGSVQEQQRRARIERLLCAGRVIADERSALGQRARRELVASSGLSPEGVELALREHLEVAPSEQDIAQLLDGYAPAAACHVVLSANVCTAALRALACALAVAARVHVKPSRRDPVLAELLLEALAADPDFAGELRRVDRVTPQPGDPVHAYGSDETMAALRASLPEGAQLQPHGSGFGVALIGRGPVAQDLAIAAGALPHGALVAQGLAVAAGAPPDGSLVARDMMQDIVAAARALAADVVPFDGRGCLTPRVALVEEPGVAEPFAEALHHALAALAAQVPRGHLDAAEQSALAQYRGLMQALGRCWEGPHHMVALDAMPESLSLGPAARVVLVLPAQPDEAAQLLAPWARHITSIGVYGRSALRESLAALCPGARWAALGRMQKPPLDGPVDRRLLA